MISNLCLLLGAFGAPQMNPGTYLIANTYPGSEQAFYRGDYFEVYSPPIKTKYGEVYWQVPPNIPLPNETIRKFAGQVMAITGYEMDMVRQTANGDVSVPIYQHYNHHYVLYVLNSKSVDVLRIPEKERKHMHEMIRIVPKPGSQPAAPGEIPMPLSQVFSEGNGGESRLSFHGYPLGTAQLVESPDTFIVQPMVINTNNPAGGRGGPRPKSNNPWPADPYLVNPLIECPCTTRISRVPSPPTVQSSGACEKLAPTAADCFNWATVVGFKATKNATISDATLPAGCSVFSQEVKSQVETVVSYNALPADAVPAPCGAGSETSTASGKTVSVNTLEVVLSGSNQTATITISGKSDVWFGIGFNAQLMADNPYAIIVDGYGNVTERKLAEHDPGRQLAPSVTVISNRVVKGIRTVVLTRPLAGKDQDYYSFSLSTTSFHFLNAEGSGPTFGYHAQRKGALMNMLATGIDLCVCKGHGGAVRDLPYREDCQPVPKTDVLQQKNPQCFYETFNGGLQCCGDGVVLLDADQEVAGPVDNYVMKFRFYYEKLQPTHRHLFRLFWMTDANEGEHAVVKCPKGTPAEQCVHTITSRFTLHDMMSNCDLRHDPWCADARLADKGVNLIYAGPHCHAPMCISMELYDESTGNLICRSTPVFGTSDKVMDEAGYIMQIPPCEWGSESEGLPPPPLLFLNTPLLSIKKSNATSLHYGDMAHWQMRGTYAN